jgi:hypothetical protein
VFVSTTMPTVGELIEFTNEELVIVIFLEYRDVSSRRGEDASSR